MENVGNGSSRFSSLPPNIPHSMGSWARRLSAESRRLAGRRLAIVLSGGATRGAFQVGVIDVFARHGILPDLLVGTSVGAINAAYWAFHPGEEVGPRLLEVWQDAARARVLPDRPLRIVGNLIGSRLHERSSLARILQRELPSPTSTIESARLPLHVVACNLRAGVATDFDRGPALTALLASAAVPGVFPPVIVDGEPYVDGGVVANCPVEVARRGGATDVFAIDLVGESSWVPGGGFGTLERAINVSLANQTRRELESLRATLRIALLRPKYDFASGFGDFSQTLLLYHHGQVAAERLLAEHWLGAQRVRAGVMEYEARAPAAVTPRRERWLRPVLESVGHRGGRAQPTEPTTNPAH
jgi:NTE family protein